MALHLMKHRFPQLSSIFTKAIFITRNFSTSSKNFQNYEIFASVCLQRQRVLTSNKNPLEEEFSNFLRNLEVKHSVYSDHELRHFEDIRISEQRKLDIDTESDIIRETALDLEDTWEAESQGFKPASRITYDDEKKNFKSYNRELTSKLLLLTKTKFGNEERWSLPMGKWRNGESLRQTAERVLEQQTDSTLNVQFLGNAPCGFHKFEYPNEANTVGAKVFFFKADLRDGKISEEHDFMWVKKQDLRPFLTFSYLQTVERFFLDF